MQSLRDLKRRIRSVKNIGQITNAMEVASMTKMRKSQVFAIGARPYALAAFEMFENLRTMTPEPPMLLQNRPVTKKLLVVVTSDKGLAGAFNENVIRKSLQYIAENNDEENELTIIAIGKKAADAFQRRGIKVQESHMGFGDFTEFEQTSPIASHIIAGFVEKQWDSVDIAYTHFRTTLRQETVIRKILPITADGLLESLEAIVPEYGRFHEIADQDKSEMPPFVGYNYEFIFEPNPREILDALLPNLLKVHFHHAILESNASEHSARMIAMKNATDNAEELEGELTLVYNKERQARITQELLEEVGGQTEE